MILPRRGVALTPRTPDEWVCSSTDVATRGRSQISEPPQYTNAKSRIPRADSTRFVRVCKLAHRSQMTAVKGTPCCRSSVSRGRFLEEVSRHANEASSCCHPSFDAHLVSPPPRGMHQGPQIVHVYDAGAACAGAISAPSVSFSLDNPWWKQAIPTSSASRDLRQDRLSAGEGPCVAVETAPPAPRQDVLGMFAETGRVASVEAHPVPSG